MTDNVSIIKGIDFIKGCTKSLMLANNLEYEEGMVIGNLKYDENITIDTHKVHKTSIAHDGTLIFFWNELDKMFWDFATSRLVPLEYKDYPTGKIPRVSYLIGDVIVKKEYDVETTKPFPMMRQTIMIPYEFILEKEKC